MARKGIYLAEHDLSVRKSVPEFSFYASENNLTKMEKSQQKKKKQTKKKNSQVS
jgi:hypothetical protein